MLRIIDNKRIDLTNSEHQLYKEICEFYDKGMFKGEDLFKDLFETDSNGIIIFLRPPKDKAYFSMEVYMFLMSVMVHQHLGASCSQAESCIQEMKNVMAEAKSLIAELKQKSS